MSNNYIWVEQTHIIECFSFKAAYQLCRQMYRHNFYCETETFMGNTRIILLHKSKTDIILYVYNELRDPLTNRKISYTDYIKSLRRNKKWLIYLNYYTHVKQHTLTIVSTTNANMTFYVHTINMRTLQQWYIRRVNKMTIETLIIDITLTQRPESWYIQKENNTWTTTISET